MPQSLKSALISQPECPAEYPPFWFGDYVGLKKDTIRGRVFGIELRTSSNSNTKRPGWWYKVLWENRPNELVPVHGDDLVPRAQKMRKRQKQKKKDSSIQNKTALQRLLD